VLALALLAGGCGQRGAGEREAQRRQAAIDELTAACVEAMVRNTCQVVNGNAPGTTASAVFVAGVGAVDAQSYRALRESGDAMCASVRQSCGADWDAPACRTARALWPAMAGSSASSAR
jgi:hypothetical protein